MREAHLRDFIAVVEAGSVRAAARRLGITQAAVSKNLSAMERSFAVPLLVRSAHGVEPTDYGRILLRHARIIDAELRKLEDEVGAHAGSRHAVVNIGISSAVESLLLAPVLAQFRSRFPDTLVSVFGGRSPTTIAALRDGKLDFVLGSPTDEAASVGLTSEYLFSAEMVIAMRRQHPMAACTDLAELAACTWIYGIRQAVPFPALLAAFRERGLPAPRLPVHCDSVSAVLCMLLQTDMIAADARPAVQPFCDRGLLTMPRIHVRFPPLVQHLILSATRPLGTSAEALAAEFRKASRRYR